MNQKEGEEKGMPILVAKDRQKRVLRAGVIPQKGKHWYGVKIASGIVDSLGYKRIILKSDQEPAIKTLRESVVRRVRALSGMEVQIVPDMSPVGESQSDGEEVAIKFIQGQIRTMRLQLQARYKRIIVDNHKAIIWLVPYRIDTL